MRRRNIARVIVASDAVRRPTDSDRRRSTSVATAVAAILAAALATGASPTRAADDAALARAKSCLNCHALDRKVVGPAYRDVARRYANDAGAEARLATKIRNGGAGAWGVVPMPANPVTPDEAARLARWVLQQK